MMVTNKGMTAALRRLKVEKNMKSKIIVDSSANVYQLPDVDFACVPLKILTDEQDLQRHTGKPHIGELVHICRGIYNDFAFHIFLHFQAAHAAVIPLSVTIIAVFQKPVNCFFKFFYKVFASR